MKVQFRSLLLAGVLLLSGSAWAQSTDPLPHGLAPHELELIRPYRDSRATEGRGITTPPSFTPRTMAEWEEIQSLVITWQGYEGILKQIVRYAKEECEVIIVCSNPTQVTSYLMNSLFGGPLPDMNNVTLLQQNSNSVWVRDYGPECMYMNEVDSLFLLDWIYNRPRPADDAVPDALGTFKNIAVFNTTQAPYDLVHTGGNFMSDGFGTAFSSELVDEENGPQGQFNQTARTPAQVDGIMTQWMGILPGRYIKMTALPYDNINHIDMHMKLLDEETLLVGQFPTGVSDGPQIEINLDQVTTSHNSVFGTPYEVIRIPMIPSTQGNFPPNASYRTYANNVFVNRTVIVPTYREQYDTTGLRILRESLPGYRVVGIDCDDQGMNIISASGAIHCITKGIGVNDPLLIRHQRLRDTYDTSNPYAVRGYIRHRTGIASAQLFWTTDTTQGYAVVPMVDVGGNEWEASIPAQASGSQVFYYIHATAVSGKEQVRPMVAPQGAWSFLVLGSVGIHDLAAPRIVDVYPNPTAHVAVIDLGRPASGIMRVELLDGLGRRVMRVHDGAVPADGRLFIDVTGLAPAVYLVAAEGPGGRAVHRLQVH